MALKQDSSCYSTRRKLFHDIAGPLNVKKPLSSGGITTAVLYQCHVGPIDLFVQPCTIEPLFCALLMP